MKWPANFVQVHILRPTIPKGSGDIIHILCTSNFRLLDRCLPLPQLRRAAQLLYFDVKCADHSSGESPLAALVLLYFEDERVRLSSCFLLTSLINRDAAFPQLLIYLI